MNCEIIDYTEKAIAVCGDTKAIKSELKALGGRFNPRLTCGGAGWIFSKSKRDQIAALLNGETIAANDTITPKKAKGIDPELKAELTEYYKKVWGKDIKMVDYSINKIAHATRLSNGLIMVIDKPEIKTSFCFGESGYDYKEAANMAYKVARTEKYFKDANLRELRSMIDELKKCKKHDEWGHATMYAYMRVSNYYGCTDRVVCEVWTSESRPESMGRDAELIPLPDADINTAIALYKEALESFEKRVNAYWKRYGASKLRTWTYWRDA